MTDDFVMMPKEMPSHLPWYLVPWYTMICMILSGESEL